MGFLDQAHAALQQGQQYTQGMTTIPGQRVGKTEQDASYDYEMPTWLYNAAGPNAIGQAQAAGSTAGFGGFGGAISNSINSIGGKNLYAARSPFQDMQGYTDNKNIYVRDPSSPGAWLSYDALSPAAKAALQGKYSALNGTNYNVLDANGNVIGQRAFTGLKDQDHVNDVMMAVAGAALGGMAAFGGAAGAGGAAAGGAGGGTFGAGGLGTGTITGGSYGLGGSTFGGASIGSGLDLGAMGASSFAPATATAGATSFGLAPEILTTPTLGEGLGLTGSSLASGAGITGSTGTSLFANPAMWSGAVPSGLSYGLAPSLGALSALQGVSPPSGPNSPSTPNPASSTPWQKLMDGSASMEDWMKLGSLGLGALAGSQPQTNSATTSKSMDPRMDSLFYGQLAPYTQGLLASQMPQAQTAGTQMLSVGSHLLGQTAPTTATNPYLKSIADDMQYRTKEMLDQNNLGIQGNAVATGSLGGSRQGVAQGLAAGKATDYLQGNVAGLYGNAYNQDQNRLLQQQTLGAGLLSQGLDTMYQPLKNTASVYSPFTGFGTSNTSTSQGGGAMGAVGGVVGAYGVGRQLGWW